MVEQRTERRIKLLAKVHKLLAVDISSKATTLDSIKDSLVAFVYVHGKKHIH
jgi:hypothetical protein